MQLESHLYAAHFLGRGLNNRQIAHCVEVAINTRDWLVHDGEPEDPDFDLNVEMQCAFWGTCLHPSDLADCVERALELTPAETKKLTRLLIDAMVEELPHRWVA